MGLSDKINPSQWQEVRMAQNDISIVVPAKRRSASGSTASRARRSLAQPPSWQKRE
jgi:hypothetical protein